MYLLCMYAHGTPTNDDTPSSIRKTTGIDGQKEINYRVKRKERGKMKRKISGATAPTVGYGGGKDQAGNCTAQLGTLE